MESLQNIDDQKKELTEKYETMSQSAKTAISTINRKDIQELKALANPPAQVKDVMCLVAYISNQPFFPRFKNGKMKEPTWNYC